MSAKLKVLANAPAFPHAFGVTFNSGMTKREYFAAQILGAIAPGFEAEFPRGVVAKIAIEYADELLRQLDATSTVPQ